MRNYKPVSEYSQRLDSFLKLINAVPKNLSGFLESYSEMQASGASEDALKNFYKEFVKDADLQVKSRLRRKSYFFGVEILKRLYADIENLSFVSNRLDVEREIRDDEKFLVKFVAKSAKKKHETSSEDSIHFFTK